MDLTLPIKKGELFNLRVTIIANYGDKYLIDHIEPSTYSFAIGGRVKFGETLIQAAQRELLEEIGLAVEAGELQYLTVLENFYTNEAKNNHLTHEYTFIFLLDIPVTKKLVLADTISLLNVDEIKERTVYPTIIEEVIQGKIATISSIIRNTEFTLNGSDSDLSFALPIKWQETKSCELNIRVCAIIRTKQGILVDTTTAEQHHAVIIGGRLQAFETIEAGLKREISEELSLEPLSYTFRGIGEDFFDWYNLRVHFINFYYEVTVDETKLAPTDEIVYACWPEHKFEQTIFKLASTKSFVLNKKTTHSISYDTIVTDIAE